MQVPYRPGRPPTLYIAGPMSGYPGANFAAFDAAARELRSQGWHVINPADMDRQRGYVPDPNEPCNPSSALKREAMRADLVAIIDSCEAIVFLPGHEASLGCGVEMALAKYLGLRVGFMDEDFQVTWNDSTE